MVPRGRGGVGGHRGPPARAACRCRRPPFGARRGDRPRALLSLPPVPAPSAHTRGSAHHGGPSARPTQGDEEGKALVTSQETGRLWGIGGWRGQGRCALFPGFADGLCSSLLLQLSNQVKSKKQFMISALLETNLHSNGARNYQDLVWLLMPMPVHRRLACLGFRVWGLTRPVNWAGLSPLMKEPRGWNSSVEGQHEWADSVSAPSAHAPHARTPDGNPSLPTRVLCHLLRAHQTHRSQRLGVPQPLGSPSGRRRKPRTHDRGCSGAPADTCVCARVQLSRPETRETDTWADSWRPGSHSDPAFPWTVSTYTVFLSPNNEAYTSSIISSDRNYKLSRKEI